MTAPPTNDQTIHVLQKPDKTTCYLQAIFANFWRCGTPDCFRSGRYI